MAAEQLTHEQVKALSRLVNQYCPNQNIAPGTLALWHGQLSGHVTHDEAVEAIAVFTNSERFTNLPFRRIQPCDILETHKLIRRERSKGYVPPPPPNPDDPHAYIAHQKAAIAAAASTSTQPPGWGQQGALEASSRRRQALERGEATYMEADEGRGRANVGSQARQAIDDVRSQLARI